MSFILPWNVEEQRLEEKGEADPLVVLVLRRVLVRTLIADAGVSRHAIVVVQNPFGNCKRGVDPESNPNLFLTFINLNILDISTKM